MSNKQLSIPGLPTPGPKIEKPRVSPKERLANLESRVLALELDVTLLRIQLEQEKDHA